MGFRNPITSLDGVTITNASLSTANSGPRAVLSQSVPAQGATAIGQLAFIGEDGSSSVVNASSGLWGSSMRLQAGSSGPSLILGREDAPTSGKWNVARLNADAIYMGGLLERPWARLAQITAASNLAASAWLTMGLAAQDDRFGMLSSDGLAAVVPDTGVYLTAGEIVCSANSANPQRNARLIVNGNPFAGAGGSNARPGVDNGVAVLTGPKVIALNAGDRVSLQGFCSAVWGTAVFTDATTNLQVIRIL